MVVVVVAVVVDSTAEEEEDVINFRTKPVGMSFSLFIHSSLSQSNNRSGK